MLHAIVYSREQLGMQSPLVMVEVYLANGLPRLSIVGLPEAAVRESKERVRSVLLSMNFEFPTNHIIVNLAPADLPKSGSRFDLPIAIGILAASHQLPLDDLQNYEMVGELALSGELRSVKGILPLALQTKNAKRKLILPVENVEEAALINDLQVFPAQHIMDVCQHFWNKKSLVEYQRTKENKIIFGQGKNNFADVYGQHHAKRALEIAAAGGHHVLLIGPPGTGKSMLASRFKTILPAMTEEEAIESATIASISQKGFCYTDWKQRPYRAPHHSASSVALVGGSNPPRPGEISLAHRGILFLDELPEFDRRVLEALREPLESGVITISRAAQQSEFPANFQLVAAMNPCPCGYCGDPEHLCCCTPEQIKRYQLRISGPLLDRIDMQVQVARVLPSLIAASADSHAETSQAIKVRVESAVQKQLVRAGQLNAKLTNQELNQCVRLTAEQQEFLTQALKKLKLSMRSYYCLLKVARTIADLVGQDAVDLSHLTEALSFRGFNFQGMR
jgi:magnesium chelatase family protein